MLMLQGFLGLAPPFSSATSGHRNHYPPKCLEEVTFSEVHIQNAAKP
jgi:hypothetical protein